MSIIRDSSLAGLGMEKINWVREHMPVLNELEHDFSHSKPFHGLRIAVCIHLEAKTAYMALVLKEAGAQVTITGSNPLSTQDEIAAALVKEGVEVFAWHNATPQEYNEHVYKTAASRPQLIIDDGGDLISLLHRDFREHLPHVYGGAEETTTGLIRLRAMEKEKVLAFPVMAVNDALCKYLFDNRYGTGQSVWDGIMRATNLVVAGKNVVVIGYGWCGKGVTMRASGMGSRVIVCEVDPVKALEAHMDGYQVMPLLAAAEKGDIFVTVTGCSEVITGEHFAVMKDKAILANAGHFDIEIDKKYLSVYGKGPRRVRTNVDEYILAGGKRIYLLSEGRLVNLAAADGHPAEIMDMSFGLQVLSLHYLLNNRGSLENKVINLPVEVDRQVAWLKLKGLQLEIDELRPDQKRYMESWELEGHKA
ncbi:MAG: adenosylhomocysteinase [Bacillota bacterium]